MILGNETIPSFESGKSTGAILDQNLRFEKQISVICKSVWYHLYQIGKMRKYLTSEQTQSAVHAHVTCRLDLNISLLMRLPKKSLNRLQNASAKLVVGLKTRDRVTAIFIQLHWLPMEQGIVFLSLFMERGLLI